MSRLVVFGPFPQYVELAEELGADAFCLPQPVCGNWHSPRTLLGFIGGIAPAQVFDTHPPELAPFDIEWPRLEEALNDPEFAEYETAMANSFMERFNARPLPFHDAA